MIIVAGIIIFLFLTFVLFVLEGKRELKQLKVSNYGVKTPKVKNDRTIAVISDFHNNLMLSEKIINEIIRIKPDVICVPGDLLKKHAGEEENNVKSIEMLLTLSKRAPVVISMGNHEEKVKLGMSVSKEHFKYLVSLMEKGNIHLLDNKRIYIDDICFVGFNPKRKYYKRIKSMKLPVNEMCEMIGIPDDNMYNVLLAHTPEYFDSYAIWGADLVLSGHNHGGMVRMPFWGGVLSSRLHPFPKYDYGLFEKDNSKMLVSNGTGSHEPTIRVNNYPEIQVVKISPVE